MQEKQEQYNKKNIIKLENKPTGFIPEVEINPEEKKGFYSKKQKINEIFLAVLTIALGICYIIAEKTTWLEIYILDYGTIDLEMIDWGVLDLTLSLSHIILIGGMFLLGIFYLLSISQNKQEKKLQIYIENPEKNTKNPNR